MTATKESAAKKKRAAQQKAYREANKEKIAAQRKAHKEKIAAQRKAHYDAIKREMAACQKPYEGADEEERVAKEKLAAYRLAQRLAKKNEKAAREKANYEANKEEINRAARERRAKAKRIDERESVRIVIFDREGIAAYEEADRKSRAAFRKTIKEEIAAQHKAYLEANKEEIGTSS
jgi:hypothetical protein